jgi:hypothetical protein
MHRHAVEYSTYSRGPRSGPGCSVPVRHHLIGPIRPTIRDAFAVRERLLLMTLFGVPYGAKKPTHEADDAESTDGLDATLMIGNPAQRKPSGVVYGCALRVVYLARLYMDSVLVPLPPGVTVVSLISSPEILTAALASVPSLLGLRAAS